MNLEIIIKDEELRSASGYVNSEYDGLINSQKVKLRRQMNKLTPEDKELIVNKSVELLVLYTAINKQINSKLNGGETDRNKHLLSVGLASYIGSEITGGYKKNVDLNSFSLRNNYESLMTIIEGETLHTSSMKNYSDVSRKLNEYYSGITKFAEQSLNSSHSEITTLQNINVTVKNRNFSIDLNPQMEKTNIQKNNAKKVDYKNIVEENFAQNFEEVEIEKIITRSHIFGNEIVLNNLERSVKDLFLYDFEKKRNPVLDCKGFKQKYLFLGDPGNGKSLMMDFALSLAKNYSEKTGIDCKGVVFSNDTSWQSGPIGMLKYQLGKVTRDNELYILLMDEIESYFPARTSHNTQKHMIPCVAEMLQFLNGSKYTNRGNYLLLSATNLPNELDKALKKRLRNGTYFVEGPKTAEQKAQLLHFALQEQIVEGNVKISNADLLRFGNLMLKRDLSGRDIHLAVEEVSNNSRGDYDLLDCINMSYQQKVQALKKQRKIVTASDIELALNSIIEKDEQEKKAVEQFRK